MNKIYPELQQFLAGYFNQDWVDDHETANDVIDFFISDSDTIAKVRLELEKLILRKKTERELKNFLFKYIGCNHYYCDDWKDGKTWLRHVASISKHTQS